MPSDKSWVVIFKWQISHYLSYGLEGMGLLKQPPWVLQAEAQSAWRPALGCRQAGEEEAERQQTSVLSRALNVNPAVWVTADATVFVNVIAARAVLSYV